MLCRLEVKPLLVKPFLEPFLHSGRSNLFSGSVEKPNTFVASCEDLDLGLSLRGDFGVWHDLNNTESRYCQMKTFAENQQMKEHG